MDPGTYIHIRDRLIWALYAVSRGRVDWWRRLNQFEQAHPEGLSEEVSSAFYERSIREMTQWLYDEVNLAFPATEFQPVEFGLPWPTSPILGYGQMYKWSYLVYPAAIGESVLVMANVVEMDEALRTQVLDLVMIVREAALN